MTVPLICHAQTEVEGAVSGEWTIDDSPYIITDRSWVGLNRSLTIEAGVEVILDCEQRFMVYGTLSVDGSEEDTVRIIQGDEDVWERSVSVAGDNAELLLEYCYFETGLGSGLIIDESATAEIVHSLLVGDVGTVYSKSGSIVSASNSVFMNQDTADNHWHSGTITTSRGRFQAEDCTIIGALDDDSTHTMAINGCWFGYTDLEGCTVLGGMCHDNAGLTRFIDCDMTSCRIVGDAEVRDCRISGSLFGSSTYDVQIFDNLIGQALIFSRLSAGTIGRNKIGLYLKIDDSNNSRDRVNISNCEVGGDLICEGEGSVFVDSCIIRGNINSDHMERFQLYRSEIHGYLESETRDTIILENNTFYVDNIEDSEFNVVFDMDKARDYRDLILVNNIVYIPDSVEETYLFKLLYFPFDMLDVLNNCIFGVDYHIYDPENRWQNGFFMDASNVYDDPLFASVDSLNFNLTEASPCIDTGHDDSPRDPDGSRADMGAYWFDRELSANELDLPESYELSVYPNPFNSQLNIRYCSAMPAYVNVYDYMGRLVKSGQLNQNKISLRFENHLPSGMYVVELIDLEQRFQNRVVMLR